MQGQPFIHLNSPIVISFFLILIPLCCPRISQIVPIFTTSYTHICAGTMDVVVWRQEGRAERRAGIAGQDEDALVEVDMVLSRKAGGLQLV